MSWSSAKTLDNLGFDTCILDYSDFTHLNLKGFRFRNCVAREALFNQSNLSQVDCSGTDFRGAEFNHANLSGADFRNAKNYWINTQLCVLKKTRFSMPEAMRLLDSLDILLEE